MLDQSILHNTRAIKRLDDLRQNDVGKLWKWPNRFFGNDKGEQLIIQRRFNAEVRALTYFLELLIISSIQDVHLGLADVIGLRGTFVEVASVLTVGDYEEEKFEEARYWKDVLRKYTRQRFDFDRAADGLADTWVTVEDTKFLVADNLERLRALRASLDELKAGPYTKYSEHHDAIGDYINLLKEVGRELKQAKADTK